ncbi:hypothetical protein HZY91_02390 [Facklamia sp. DSM 111018]|uniref:Lantibiotic ABC transporter permease n=1 Tax=Facklamia lactis TaxID=2749967 RepID=A0ABS0LNN2_9LACT|nr:hypothetical protein [Facklamia lactis]MBG9979581.1 hypothetical protein [Facklamia lactis]MBG9985739.1 hypothetical protein [Facklamia lactis]
MMNIDLNQLERSKYSSVMFIIISVIILIVNVGACIPILGNGVESEHIWFSLMDAFAFFQLILAPLVIASLYTLCVQVENKHNMWKIIKSSGIDLNRVFHIKFWFIQKKLIALYLLQLLTLIIVGKSLGIQLPIPWLDLGFYALSLIGINFALSAVHYYLALRFENPMLGMAIAVFGALSGIGFSLISKMLTYFVPYSWYSFLIRIQHNFVDGKLTQHLISPNIYPLLASIILGIIFYQLGQKVEVEA